MFYALRFLAVSGVEMKMYERSLQALSSFPAPRTRVSFHVLFPSYSQARFSVELCLEKEYL